MTFSKFDTMITHEETFCQEWDALCKDDWLAAQEAMEMDDAIDEANAEAMEELDGWYDDLDDIADFIAEVENYAERD